MRVHTRETLTFRAWTCPLPSSAFRTVSGLRTSRPSHKSSGPGTAASATTCKLISFWSRRPIRRRDAPVLSVERAMPWRQKHIARSVLIQEPSKITRAETRRHEARTGLGAPTGGRSIDPFVGLGGTQEGTGGPAISKDQLGRGAVSLCGIKIRWDGMS